MRFDIKSIVLQNISRFDFDSDFVFDSLQKTKRSYAQHFSYSYSIYKSIIKQTDKESIVCIMENGIDLFSMFFALMLSDKRIVLIDPQKSSDEIKSILDYVKSKFIIVDSSVSEKIKDFDLIYSDVFGLEEVKSDKIKSLTLGLLDNRDFDSDYLLTFTSGTTGLNKGVRHTLSSLFLSAYEFNNVFSINSESTFGHIMPMTYMAGILNSIFQPFIAGSKIVLLGKFGPLSALNFWQNALKYKINTYWISPGMLTIIDKMSNINIGIEACTERQITFFVGTAPLIKAFQIDFENKFGANLFGSYGLSETLYISTENISTRAQKDDQNVGGLLKGVEYKISHDSELLVKVPWMFLSYINENTEEYFQDEYYKTGDLAIIDNNVLSIIGRKKELIIRGGYNISPAAIEKAVIESNLVSDCAVFGIKNHKNNDESVILAYSLSDKTNKDDLHVKINSFISDKLGVNYTIDKSFSLASIPKNNNGKTDKIALKKVFENQINDN